MPETFLLYVTGFAAAAVALFSGFGIGTVLTPAFLLYYEPKTAIFLVAIVHLLNNLLKLCLFYKHVDVSILRRFGVAALMGAIIGSIGQFYVGNIYLKKFIALFLIFSMLPKFLPPLWGKVRMGVDPPTSILPHKGGGDLVSHFRLPKKIDFIGGFFSGLLGGLAGNQGAIRSAFLLNYEISKETFIATGVVIACIIDLIRVPIYSLNYLESLKSSWPVLIILILVTFAGTFLGNYLLKRFSAANFKKLVSAFIMTMGLYLLVT